MVYENIQLYNFVNFLLLINPTILLPPGPSSKSMETYSINTLILSEGLRTRALKTSTTDDSPVSHLFVSGETFHCYLVKKREDPPFLLPNTRGRTSGEVDYE